MGTFHPDNIIVSKAGPIVIDWQNGTTGNPAADVARTVVLVEMGIPFVHGIRRAVVEVARKMFLSTYLKEYFGITGMTWDDVYPWILPVGVGYNAEGLPEDLVCRLFRIQRPR